MSRGNRWQGWGGTPVLLICLLLLLLSISLNLYSLAWPGGGAVLDRLDLIEVGEDRERIATEAPTQEAVYRISGKNRGGRAYTVDCVSFGPVVTADKERLRTLFEKRIAQSLKEIEELYGSGITGEAMEAKEASLMFLLSVNRARLDLLHKGKAFYSLPNLPPRLGEHIYVTASYGKPAYFDRATGAIARDIPKSYRMEFRDQWVRYLKTHDVRRREVSVVFPADLRDYPDLKHAIVHKAETETKYLRSRVTAFNSLSVAERRRKILDSEAAREELQKIDIQLGDINETRIGGTDFRKTSLDLLAQRRVAYQRVLRFAYSKKTWRASDWPRSEKKKKN
jgi:hypothetical protein